MPAAYSYDLRRKAMEALDEGKSKTEVARMFLFSNLFVKLLIMLFFNCFYYYEKGYNFSD